MIVLRVLYFVFDITSDSLLCEGLEGEIADSFKSLHDAVKKIPDFERLVTDL